MKLIDTKTGIPNELYQWVNATLFQRRGSSKWEILEDRESCNLTTECGKDDQVDRALCFCQPPRRTADATAFSTSINEIDLRHEILVGNVASMSKKHCARVRTRRGSGRRKATASRLEAQRRSRVSGRESLRSSHRTLKITRAGQQSWSPRVFCDATRTAER